VLWICWGARRKAKFSRVVGCVIHVDVLEDGVVSHGVDFIATLELKVVRVRLIKINPHDSAEIEGVVILPVAIPPGVGHHHGKADEPSSPVLVHKDNVLALGGGRSHRDGRVMEKRKQREVVSCGCDVFFVSKYASCL
jgi:hypothetical protein